MKFFSKAKIDNAIDNATKNVKAKTASVLKAITSMEGGNIEDYVKITDIPDGSISRYIKQLKDSGLIEFKGATQTGGYYLTNRMKLLLSDKNIH